VAQRPFPTGERAKRGTGRFLSLTLALVIACVGLTACQKNGWKIGVLNQCGKAVEAWTLDTPDPASSNHRIDWHTLGPNEAEIIWQGAESEEWGNEYLWVRADGSSDTPQPIRVDHTMVVRDLGNRYVYTVVAGERCP
jgi:hypothetical protein